MADMEAKVKAEKKRQPDAGRRQAQIQTSNQAQDQTLTQNQGPAQDKSQNQSLPEDPWAALSLEEGMEKLDELLAVLEDPGIPLEKAFGLYQQGVGLLKHCSGRIDTVEKKILMMNGDGGFDEF